MESLLPLIIAVALSAILSVKKKKTQKSVPTEKTTLPGSPWDDLVRELKDDTSRPAAPEPTPYPMPAESYAERQKQSPVYSYDDDLPSETSDSQFPAFSYDQQAIDEAERQAALAASAYSSPDAAVLATPVTEENPTVSGNPERNDGFFAGGFDARKGIVYAEIMRPKFLEY